MYRFAINSASLSYRRENTMKSTAIEKARKDREKLAKEYGIPISCVVWCGNNKYIVIKNRKEIRV